ncbi:lipase 3-like [Haematobia irritans]|uniref:lipase 3-like n=1 Tax=Haematobia irritans TaxID=7368 RepID=UPI003F50C756
MQSFLVFVIAFALLFVNVIIAVDTCDRILQHGYPCERHKITTKDGYILTIFRIPYSHHREGAKSNGSLEERPNVLLTHCLECSSDIWILSGPENGLPFMLADAGYDVWLANARGNEYCEQHIKLKTSSPAFWEFALDEIGSIDLPATIDFILETTKARDLHYVGYSQGTMAFMIALGTDPTYNEKIRTSHLVGPAIFVCHVKGPFPALGIPWIGSYNPLSVILGTIPFHEITGLSRNVSPLLCQRPEFNELCIQILGLIVGWGSPYLNRTLLPELLSTHPAGGSLRQVNHFAQMALSCKFRAYDFGPQENLLKYGSTQSPDYNLANVHPNSPIDMYFSDNDYLATPEDVFTLYKILGNKATWNRVKYPKFNHFDFTVSLKAKSCINDCILDRMQKYEKRSFSGLKCKCFRKRPF